ncbi:MULTISPECIES: hypothetical protein [unclassified Paenibacillus]|uniref:hypothetical protein n=1 Tax=unclassified Paenibacillus TaxID=185978 RepID=UPI00277DA55D|nr:MULTISPECIES: hypothetical protein [unclassified Paenibacillus]MDQ0896315.1 hypothetical protein [Paenibacillus sp. V4I7]MDQ0913758.1 hypothetical protein [Paenibacillus sp. V4I5]
MSDVISYEEYEKLSREDRIDIMMHMRKEIPEKVIRETWGMDYKKFYMHLYHLGLKGKNESVVFPSQEKKRRGRPSLTEEEKAAKAKAKTQKKQDQVNNGRKIIDAEFSVVSMDNGQSNNKEITEQEVAMALAQTCSASHESNPRLSIEQSESYMRREFKGSPESIVKRLAAISGMLELEDFDMVLKIEVYKA